MSRPHFPQSTYRLQFHAGFTFRDAAKIIPYLHDLGITHIYASPILKARPGSTHGYDVVDPTMLNPELGTAGDFCEYVETMKRHGIEQIVDIVPNHMGVGTNENPWWNDVLENGPASRYAEWFDIAWHDPLAPELRNKVMLPVLGQPYRESLDKGDIRLTYESGRFFANYYERRFPLAPQTYAMILNYRADREPAASRAEGASRRPAVFAVSEPAEQRVIDENVALFNGTPGDPRSFDLLDDVLNQQFYRLCYWRDASDKINYRRFFDVSDLAAICMEREDVFEASHALVLRLVSEGKIAGLRIDHPDGLLDPEEYFLRLQRRFAASESDAARTPLYVVAEKILAADEPLPEQWAISGTTGYDFINHVNGLFVDPANAPAFTERYNTWIGSDLSFAEICYQRKRLILTSSLAADLLMLANQLDHLGEQDRRPRVFSFAQISDALRETIACFPVYRTYISDRGIGQRDVQYVEMAIHAAIERNPLIDRAVFEFVRDMILLRYPLCFTEEDRAAQRRFVGKFQQLTSPVTAKGIEDTAFYVFNRFMSLNEVGGDPGRFGAEPDVLHQWLGDRREHWPYGLSPLSTHDTKRSEDVRARLNVLSEMPDEWWSSVARWSRLNEPHRGSVAGKPAPDTNDEYLLYQTLVGVWPLDAPAKDVRAGLLLRVQQYMRKAIREAKVHTSWTDPDAGYEKGVNDFIATILAEERSEAFLADFRAFGRRIAHFGFLNSLSQSLLRLTAPGVPDTYQGTELWDFSLVDPDNRRPVDYDQRARMLRELQSCVAEASRDRAEFARELISEMKDARAKLFVTWRALTCRREHPGLFSAGRYIPLQFAGARREHVFGFLRELRGQWAMIVVPRLMCGMIAAESLPLGEQAWGETQVLLPSDLAGLRFRNQLTGGEIVASVGEGPMFRIGEVFRDFPVALAMTAP